MEIDLGALEPAPGKVVANLPYGIAAGVAAAHDRGAADGRSCGWRWCSARSASAWPPRPGSGAYGAPSVLAQLACEVEVAAGDPRTVFHAGAERRLGARAHAPPRAAGGDGEQRRAAARCARWSRARSPTGARRWPARSRWRGGRRRALARAGARGAGAARATRGRARGAPLPRGLPGAGARARAVTATRVGRAVARWRRRRSTSACSWGPYASGDGRHELVTVMQSISLADELTLEPAPAGGAAR